MMVNIIIWYEIDICVGDMLLNGMNSLLIVEVCIPIRCYDIINIILDAAYCLD